MSDSQKISKHAMPVYRYYKSKQVLIKINYYILQIIQQIPHFLFYYYSEFMKRNEEMEQKFENYLSLRHSKQFHIVDSPNVTFSLACKNNLQISTFVNSVPNQIQVHNTIKDKNFVSKTRYMYRNLKIEIKQLLNKIFKCLSHKKIAISQFFDFQQVVLSGFMKELIDQLTQQCKQKGQFLQFLWSSTMKLMKNILQIFQRNDTKNQISNNNQLYQTHKKYTELLQNQRSLICQNSIQIENLKNIISLLITKGRQKRKEIKKIIDSSYKLISMVNQVKQRNQMLETKCTNLIENTIFHNKVQSNQIIQKTNYYDKLNQRIISIQNCLFKYVWLPEIQEYFEGPMKVQNFIKQAVEAFQNQIKSSAEVKAQLDTLVDKVEQDYQQPIELTKSERKQSTVVKENLEQIKQQQLKAEIKTQFIQKQYKKIFLQYGTQTTYTDKYNNLLIKTVGIMTNLDNRKNIIYENLGTQYDKQIFYRSKNKKFGISKVIDIDFYTQSRSKSNKRFRISILDSNCNLKSSTNQINMLTSQCIVSNESVGNTEKNQLGDQYIKKINKKASNQQDRKSLIKSRYSTMQSSPKKVSNFQRKEKNSKIFNQNLFKNQKRRSATQFQTNAKNENEKFKQTSQQNQTSSRTSKVNRFSANLQKQNFQTLKQKKNKRNPSKFMKMNNASKTNSSSCYLKSYLNINEPQNIQKIPKIQYFSKIRQSKKKRLSLKQIKECLQSFEDFVQSYQHKLQNQSKNNNSGIKIVMQTAIQKKIKKQNTKMVNDQINFGLLQTQSIKQRLMKNMRQFNLKPKKFQNQMSYRHIYSVIGSVYGRVLAKIEGGYIIQNFVGALFQSIQVLYGNLQKQDLQKKVIHFLNQINSKKNDHICKSFIFMLGLDENDKYSQMITNFDIYLYMKLISLLSHSENPLSDISQTTTDFHKLYQILPKILKQQKISGQFLENIIIVFKKSIPKEQTNENKEKIQQRKFNLFYCCQTIVKLIIQSKEKIRKDFRRYFQFFATYNSNNQVICLLDLLAVTGTTKNNILTFINDIQIKKLHKKNIELEDFVQCLLQLGICSFEEYYIKVLNKFEINSYQKRNQLLKHKTKLSLPMITQKNEQQQIIQDILILNIAQKSTSILIENMMGKQLGLLYSFSVLLFSQI